MCCRGQGVRPRQQGLLRSGGSKFLKQSRSLEWAGSRKGISNEDSRAVRFSATDADDHGVGHALHARLASDVIVPDFLTTSPEGRNTGSGRPLSRTTPWAARRMRPAGATHAGAPARLACDYLWRSAAFSRPSDSAQAAATAEFGSVLPGIVAQPPFSTNLLWSHE